MRDRMMAIGLISVGAACVLGLGLAARSVHAQGAVTAEAYKMWMDDAGDSQEDLRDALTMKQSAQAAAAAAKILDVMARTETYWAAKHADDIVKLAQTSRALAKQVVDAAAASRFEEAAAAFATLSTSCNSCHDLHPEKR